MSMLDFAGALGGAPGAGAPDLGGGTPQTDLGGGPPSDQGGQGGFSNSMEALDAAEEALHAFIQLDPDQADRAVAAQALQTVLKLKASNQQSAQSGDLKSLARALQGGPGANAGPVGAALGG